MPLKRAGLLFIFFALSAVLFIATGRTQTGAPGQGRDVFGPETFVRTSGATNVYARSFQVPPYVSGPFTLRIQNGQANGTNRIEDAISSGSVSVNGVEVVHPSDFNQKVGWIERAVDLNAQNSLAVTLNSAPGSFIILGIGGMIDLGPLGRGRAGHTATIQTDGSVLIIGGRDSDGPLADAERFNPQTFGFEPLSAALPFPRSEPAAAMLADGNTLISGGTGGTIPLGTTELFHPDTGQFTSAFDSLRYPRAGHTATALLDGRVLIAGGRTDGATDRAEAFDAQHGFLFKPPFNSQSGIFIALPGLLTEPRWDHAAALLPGGKILIVGGRNESGFLASAELFDPEFESFTPIPGEMTVPRAGHTATVLSDGRVLILGGENESGPLASGEIFDPQTHSFLPAAPLSQPRSNHTATRLSFGEILIVGGENGSGILDTAEFYGPPAPDTTRPVVVSVSPPDGSADVDTAKVIGMRFSEPMNVTTLNAAGITLSDGQPVAAVVAPGGQGLLAYVLPEQPLSPGATYTVSINDSVTDPAGNPIVPFSSQFTAVAVPIIASVLPNTAVPNAQVTINGQNFDPNAPTLNTVRFNGAEAVVTSATATQIQTSVPFTAPTGPGSVSVETSGGSASAFFIVAVPAPVLDSISPDTAVAGDGGFEMTLTGSGFIPSSQVILGNILFPSEVTPNQIKVNVPASVIASGGSYAVRVSNPDGRIPIESNSMFFTVNYPVPSIGSLAPASALRYSPGVSVTINGENFVEGSKVRINGTIQVSSFIDPSTLSILLPNSILNTPQSARIVVENPTPGGGPSNPVFFEVLNPAPAVDSISPTEWTAGYPDLTLSVQGSGFVPESQIEFNGILINPATATSTDLTVPIPASALNRVGTFPAKVINSPPGGGTSNLVNFHATQVITADPETLNQGAFHRKVVVQGPALFPGSTIAFSGSGITVHSIKSRVDYDVTDSRSGGPAFDWIDATSEPPLPPNPALPDGDDNWYSYLSPGFPFYLYGQSEGSFVINTNGILLLGGTSPIPHNAAKIPDSAFPDLYMAPYWDDIGGGHIYTQLLGTAPNRRRVVQWDHFSSCTVSGWLIGCISNGNDLTFEAILSEAAHSITFQYLSLSGPGSDGASATVGLEGAGGLEGVPYLINGLPDENRLANGLAITFTPTLALELDVSVDPSTATGLRDAIITTPDGNSFIQPDLIDITPSPMQIQITSPLSGTQTGRASVLVEGLVPTQSGEIGVVVNGVIAQVSGDRFAANHVPLEPGVNTITAVATDFDGNNTADSVTVTAVDPKDPVLLLANPESGTDPLEVQFSILTDLNAVPVSITLDADGDGTDDLSFVDLSDEPLFTYPHPGLYKATVTLTDDQGMAYSDTLAINVLSLEDLDTLLKARWEGMKTALSNQDVDGALKFFTPHAEEKYRYVFESLFSYLPEIAGTMEPIRLVETQGPVIECFTNRVEDGVLNAYFIYFSRDPNGLWKLSAM